MDPEADAGARHRSNALRRALRARPSSRAVEGEAFPHLLPAPLITKELPMSEGLEIYHKVRLVYAINSPCYVSDILGEYPTLPAMPLHTPPYKYMFIHICICIYIYVYTYTYIFLCVHINRVMRINGFLLKSSTLKQFAPYFFLIFIH